jgi:hypothetical protein
MKRSQYITAPVTGEDQKAESEHVKIGAKDEIKNITERLGEMKVVFHTLSLLNLS